MAEPLQRRVPDDAFERQRPRRFDDDEPLEEVAEVEEPAPRQSLWVRLYLKNSYLVAALVLIVVIVATGYVGGQMIEHARQLRDVVPRGAQQSLDWSLGGFLVLSGLFMGLAFAGTVGHKVWTWIAIVGLAATVGTAWMLTGSMRDQLSAVLATNDAQCTPAVMQNRVNGKLVRTATRICTPAAPASRTGTAAQSKTLR
jgi:hypothetical protein